MIQSMVSPKVKFIAVTIDEMILVPLALAVIYYYFPEYFVLATIALIIGAIVFVVAKYYLIYPSLLESSSHPLYGLTGMHAIVVEEVTETSGKIKIGSEIWEARGNPGVSLAVGTEVKIIERSGLLVRVAPIDPVDSSS